MATEYTKAAAEAAEEVVVVAEKELPPPQPEAEEASAVGKEAEGGEKLQVTEKDEKSIISQSVSFKEETNVVGKLPDSQKKALDELKQLLREALEKREFSAPPPPTPEEEKKKEEVKEEKPTEAVVVAEEPPPPPPPPPSVAEAEVVVVVEEVVEKVEAAVIVDDDGAKTVEAIKETIVEVSAAVVKTGEVAAPPPPPALEPEQKAEPEGATPLEPEKVSLWGVTLLGDDGEKSDVVLLKFLRARDFKPKEALAMIKSTVWWRKEFGVEAGLMQEDLGTAMARLEELVYVHGTGRDGHPVCYNLYGELGRRKEVHEIAFADEEKRKGFLKWRVQFMERAIERHLDFRPNGVCSFVQVNDMKNSPGLLKREVWAATNKAVQLLQDNYPEFVAKQVFINTPWWYLFFSKAISPFLTQRSKSKFVFATPSKTSEALFKYIAPEQVPVQYGGLSRSGEQKFTAADTVTEVTIKAATNHTVEFPLSGSYEVAWEVRVVGWEVSYGVEFVPESESSYAVIVSKTKAMSNASDNDPIVSDSFKAKESGKVVITIDNHSSKKKILLYRSKTKPVH
ncbi:hypothetical protein SAY86_020612 [Trapa natans]|uniref:Patellin-3 n=1 Tax=Trapa natans TaxID=22666 RepID=A0AAN7LZX8_TRANT|nr:hypothetical protein SAY86_020612 [Trapa natans]